MHGFSAAVGRATHKVMAKLGKAEETMDPEYTAAKQRTVTEGKKMKLIARHTEKLMELYRNNAVVFGEVVDEFATLNTAGPGVNELVDSLKEIESARVTAETNLREQLCAPVYHFHEQYKMLKNRMKEHSTRKCDMDRYHDTLLSKTEKAGKGKGNEGLGEADAKYRTARENYQQLHEELMKDMARLHDELKPFLAPCTAVFMKEQAAYASVFGAALGRLAGTANSVSTACLADYPHVITPPERSVAGSAAGLTEKQKKDAEAPTEVAPAVTCEAANAASGTSSSTTTTTTATTFSSSSSAISPRTTAPPPVRSLPQPGAAAPRPTPQPPVKPRSLASPPQKTAKALYNFVPEDSTELGFQKGDVITVISANGDWWQGQLGDRSGLFPGNYVQLL